MELELRCPFRKEGGLPGATPAMVCFKLQRRPLACCLLFLWRLLAHETFKGDKRSTQTQRSDTFIQVVHTVLLDLRIEKTQAILRVAEHQAGVRKPKACGSCVQECAPGVGEDGGEVNLH